MSKYEWAAVQDCLFPGENRPVTVEHLGVPSSQARAMPRSSLCETASGSANRRITAFGNDSLKG